MKRKIIGVCGFIGSGKNTVGDILVENYGFQRVSFADKVKDGISAVFGWPRDMLEGNTLQSREWREQPDDFWSEELGRKITPRHVMQTFGTNCMREGFDKNVWVLLVKDKILKNPNVNFVVPDVRFYNERGLIKELGGEVWRVKRGDDPEWVTSAINDNKYDTSWMKEYPDIHESEWRWLDHPTEFERNIPNDTDLDSLKEEVRKAIENN